MFVLIAMRWYKHLIFYLYTFVFS